VKYFNFQTKKFHPNPDHEKKMKLLAASRGILMELLFYASQVAGNKTHKILRQAQISQAILYRVNIHEESQVHQAVFS
jgi:hypothetical protein